MYTVKKLANISGVSVRTLHWYDKIGLLTPVYRTEKGYREYDEENLLDLQQILIFRALELPLADIQKLLKAEGFDRLQALRRHRATLSEKAKSFQAMIRTIEGTIAHLEGDKKMQFEEFYKGLGSTPEKQREYEEYLIDSYGNQAREKIDQCKQRTVQWAKADWEKVNAEGDRIYKAVTASLVKGDDPASQKVQKLIADHCAMIDRLYEVDKAVYLGLGELYCSHADFGKFFVRYDAKLPEYLRKAMTLYADAHLS